jgi:hypothetical protein
MATIGSIYTTWKMSRGGRTWGTGNFNGAIYDIEVAIQNCSLVGHQHGPDDPFVIERTDTPTSSGSMILTLKPTTQKLVLVDVDGTELGEYPLLDDIPSSVPEPALLLHPYMGRGYGQFWAAGWKPHGFNQQWGGPWGGALPDGSGGEAWFEGFISPNTAFNLGASAATAWKAFGFKPSYDDTLAAVWVKLSKVGSPTAVTEPLAVTVKDDSSEPNATITNGTATVPDPLTITSDTAGDWVRCSFATPPAMTPGAQLYVVLNASGADGSNYYQYHLSNDSNYPHGNVWSGNDATPSTWTESPGYQGLFLLEYSNGKMQSNGIFSDGKLSLIADDPAAPYIPAKYLGSISHEAGTLLWRGKVASVSKPILDLMTGSLDSTRIRLSTTAAGKAYVELWESDGTPHSIEGSTDITNGGAGDVEHDVAVVWTTSAITLYVDAASEGTPVSSTITLDESLKNQGVLMIGGFPTAPTWDDDWDKELAALPSAGDYTVNLSGTTEPATWVLNADGTLSKVKSGTDADTSYYSGDNVTPANGTGWGVEFGYQYGVDVFNVIIDDGTGEILINVYDGYLGISGDGSADDYYVQLDTKTCIRNYYVTGKSSDFYIYVDGALIFDGTGLLTGGSASAGVSFGDNASGADTQGKLSHFRTYDGGNLLHSCGAQELSELALWGADQSAYLADLWNSGTQQSVATACGLSGQVPVKSPLVTQATGITADPALTTSMALVSEMERFILAPACDLRVAHQGTYNNTTAGQTTAAQIYIDGAAVGHQVQCEHPDANNQGVLAVEHVHPIIAGLHSVEARATEGGGAGTGVDVERGINVEVKQ